jgi:putative transposase
MDETYIKLNGKWVYLYRAVDKYGQTVDFLLRAKRDAVAAKALFTKAFKQHGAPEKVTVDKSGSNKSALDSCNRDLGEGNVLRHEVFDKSCFHLKGENHLYHQVNLGA